MFSIFDYKSYTIYPNNIKLLQPFHITLSHLRDDGSATTHNDIETIYYSDIEFILNTETKYISDYPAGTKFYLENSAGNNIIIFNKQVIENASLHHDDLKIYSDRPGILGNYIDIIITITGTAYTASIIGGGGVSGDPYIILVELPSSYVLSFCVNEINTIDNNVSDKVTAITTSPHTTVSNLTQMSLSGGGNILPSTGLLWSELEPLGLNSPGGSLSDFIVGVKNESIVMLSCSDLSKLTGLSIYAIMSKSENDLINTIYYTINKEDSYTQSFLSNFGFSNDVTLEETIDGQVIQVWKKIKGTGWLF